MQRENTNRCSCSVLVLVSSLWAAPVALGTETCPANPLGGPDICVNWDLTGTPAVGTDFLVDYVSNSDRPIVTLKRGANWNVRSKNADDTPGHIGAIKIDPNISTDDFGVTIANGAAPGAADVDSANLTAASWTGLSSVTSGHITGDVGAITVAADSAGAGGVLNLRVEGNATGAIVAETVTGTLDIDGTQSGTITINDDVTGDLIINKMEGDVTYKADLVGGDITIESWIKGGTLWVQGDVPNTTTMISIADLQSSATEHAEVYLGSYSQPNQFWGDLELLNGIPAGQDVFFYASLGGTSVVIDLNGRDLGGILFIFDGGYGQIINGGTIKNGGLMQIHSVGGGAPPTFSGSATFGGVEAGGILRSVAVSLDEATVTINGAMAGAIDLVTDIKTTSELVINGAMAGTVDIGGDLSGTLDINGASSGSIHVVGAMSGLIDVLNDVSGVVSLEGACSGDVTVGGLLRADLLIKDEFTATGNITIGGDTRADIEISGDAAGDIMMNGHVYGDVNIASDLTGTITIDDSLKATGRILVTGLLDGSVSIGTETEALSQIRADQGLGTNGCIIINADQGAFDANGIIHLGPATIPDPLNNVTFDGGIKIFDQWPFGGAGDLEGSITVTGCHATAADLDICVDGNINGTITLNQTGCTNQVTHSCVGGCP